MLHYTYTECLVFSVNIRKTPNSEAAYARVGKQHNEKETHENILHPKLFVLSAFLLADLSHGFETLPITLVLSMVTAN
jgi:hypothetical protein